MFRPALVITQNSCVLEWYSVNNTSPVHALESVYSRALSCWQ